MFFFSCCSERPANAHNLEIQPYLGEHLCPKPCWANTKTHPPDPHVEQLINPMTWSFTMFYPFDSTYHLGVSKETPVKTSEFNAGAGCIHNVRAYIPNIWGNLRTNYNIGLWQWREHKPGHFGCSTIHFWCDHKHVCRWLSCYERGCMSLQKKKAGYSLNRHFWQKNQPNYASPRLITHITQFFCRGASIAIFPPGFRQPGSGPMAVGSAKPVAIRLPAEMTPIKFSGALKNV